MAVKKNVLFNIIMVFSQMAFPVIILPYISRILGVKNIGVFNLVDSFAQYFIMFAALGIPIYGIRAISQASTKSKEDLNETFSELITVQTILTLILMVVYYGFVYFNPTVIKYQEYYILGSVQFLMGIFSVEWFFQGIENFKFISIRTFFIKVASILCIFIFINKISDAYLYYVINTIFFIVIAVLNIAMLYKNVKFVFPKTKNLKKHIKPLLTFFTTKFVISVYVSFSIILIGFLSTEKEVGFFTLAYKAYNVVIALITTIPIVIISKATVLIQNKDFDSYKTLIEKVFTFIIVLGIPAIFFTFLYAENIVYILGGHEFLYSSISLKILSVLILVIALSNIFALNILTPLKKEKYFLRSALTGMVLSILLNVFLIPKYGSVGASISLLIAEIVVFIILIYYCNKTFVFNFNVKNIIWYSISCLPFIPIYYFINTYVGSSFFVILIGSIISLLLYYCIIIFLLKDNLLVSYHKTYIVYAKRILLKKAN